MIDKADSETTRRQNRSIVLRALRAKGPLARIELGRQTGLSPASITSIAGQLMAERIIDELPALEKAASGRRGRPMVRLDLAPKAASVMVMRIGVDAVDCELFDYAGSKLGARHLPPPEHGMNESAFGRTIAREIEALLQETGIRAGPLSRIGIVVQGAGDSRDGSIIWSPVLRDCNVQLAKPIAQHMGVTCDVFNDANMLAEGLATREPGLYGGITAVIFIGFGVGMGLVINGRVYHGATGAASEFGHMNHIPYGALCRCGSCGCIEAYAADYGIMRMAEGRPDDTTPPSLAIDEQRRRALIARATAGDTAVLHAFAKAGEALGFGIARMIALVNPDRVVIAAAADGETPFIAPALQAAIASGLAPAFRRNVAIEFAAFSNDMIISGTRDALLRAVDAEILASGPITGH